MLEVPGLRGQRNSVSALHHVHVALIAHCLEDDPDPFHNSGLACWGWGLALTEGLFDSGVVQRRCVREQREDAAQALVRGPGSQSSVVVFTVVLKLQQVVYYSLVGGGKAARPTGPA